MPGPRQTDDKIPQYRLILTRADTNIWYSMPENNEEGERKAVKVTRREASLPPDLAGRVCGLWEAMLRGVRYPKPEEMPSASTGRPSSSGGHEALEADVRRDVVPDPGRPFALVDLGRSLIEYVDADEAGRAARLKAVDEKCRALERYLAEKKG
jgi:hypothetical protein